MASPSDVLRSRRTLLDYQDLQRQFDLMKQRVAITGKRGGGVVPATIQIANEIEEALAAGDTARANLLHQIHKTFDRGIEPYAGQPVAGDMELPPELIDPAELDPLVAEHQNAVLNQQNQYGANPNQRPVLKPAPIPGYGNATGSIKADQARLEKQAQKDVELEMDPAIAYETKRETDRAAREGEAEKKLPTKQRVTSTITKVADLYNELNQLGAAVTPENSVMGNISARAGASDLGQWAGGYLGTEAQRVRDEIAALRPSLMNDIRQASEMGARGLDSEKELQFYLTAATDPTRSLEANMTALMVINQAYGLGSQQFQRASPAQLQELQREFQEANKIKSKDTGTWKFLGVE